VDTPAFLLWSLEYTCQVRGFESGRDPERTERLLRAARAASDALREGRVLDGIAAEPPYGFRLNDALSIYGGLEAVEACCTACPANAAAAVRPATWAGCYGLLPLTDPDELNRRLSAAVNHEQVCSEFSRLFQATQPPWHGLWLRSPLSLEQAQLLATIFKIGDLFKISSELADLEASLRTSVDHHLPLHVVQYPPGQVEQGWWRLATHCPRCKAVWHDSRNRHCPTCDYSGPPAPDKKRRARGRRPYLLLERLLGSQAAADFLSRYLSFQAQPRPPDPPPSQPPPAPPDNRPAG
jgi:hypothetical protein